MVGIEAGCRVKGQSSRLMFGWCLFGCGGDGSRELSGTGAEGHVIGRRIAGASKVWEISDACFATRNCSREDGRPVS